MSDSSRGIGCVSKHRDSKSLRFVYAVNVWRTLALVVVALSVLVGEAQAQEYKFVRKWPDIPGSVTLNSPEDVAVDVACNIYIADSGHNLIQNSTPRAPT